MSKYINVSIDGEDYELGFTRWTAEGIKLTDGIGKDGIGPAIKDINQLATLSFEAKHADTKAQKRRELITWLDDNEEGGFGQYVPALLEQINGFFGVREKKD